MSVDRFDVVFVTDARMVGGGNKSIAQEVLAHSAAGYSTGLLSLAGPARGGARPVDVSLMRMIEAGKLTMIRPDQPAEASIVIARGPSMFLADQRFRPNLRAKEWFLIANAFNTDPAVSNLLYNPHEVSERASALFNHEWTWVPLSQVVRARMLAAHPKLALAPFTWSNIIQTSDWWFERPDTLERPIRLGRHSRDAPAKWPTSKRDIFDAYPADRRFIVSVMGGAKVPRSVLGRTPKNWRVQGFGARSPQEFLRTVDVYPYFHHPELQEAFGRSVLEALASGAVAILPEYFRQIFFDAAIYATPRDVREIAIRLAEDPNFLAERRTVAREIIEEHFSYASHVERLRDIIGPPSHSRDRTQRVSRNVPLARDLSASLSKSPRVLFFTDNGHGLGHVTRLMAYAKRLDSDVKPFFLTMSEAYRLVSEQGFPVEYFPSVKKMGFEPRQKLLWESLAETRMRLLLDRVSPRVVVVDHVNPPSFMKALRRDYPDIKFVWSRRGLWRQQRKPAGLRMADGFDYVLEPMDVAAAVDMGFTPRLTSNTVYVPPISLVDRAELLSREAARGALGLPLDGLAVLLNLSADTTEDLIALIRRVSQRLQISRRTDRVTVFAPRHALHSSAMDEIPGVIMRPVYPVTLYANAFDAAISTAGYNSYHELVHLGVPTVFVARTTDTLDDQNRRAGFATVAGFGDSAQSVDSLAFEDAIDSLMNGSIRARMKAAAFEVFPYNGAHQAAKFLSRLAKGESVEFEGRDGLVSTARADAPPAFSPFESEEGRSEGS